MKWTETYRLGAAESDINRIASPSALLRYMQNATNCQMMAMGPSYEELFDRGYAFILSKISYSIYGTISAHDDFKVETWATPSRGVTFNRCYKITKGDALIAEGVSLWALVNTREKKLCRVGEVELNYGEDAPLELDAPTRFRIPPEAPLTLVGERLVEYADCDLNGHMNNTRYPDILCSYICSMAGVRPAKISINFVSEAKLGDSVKIYSGFCDDAYYVRTVKEDGKTNVEAEIVLEDILPARMD